MVAGGEFEPGRRLPTERELSATLEVSRTTVREALQRLLAAGYVTTRRGRGGGTFIQTGAGPGSDEMIKRTLDPAWDELGVSMGGMIAQEYALAYPGDLLSVTFACTYAAPGLSVPG